MKSWIVLPFDGSPMAKATLQRAARETCARRGPGDCAGIVLAVAGIDPDQMPGLVAAACRIAGDVPLEFRLLAPGDPVGDFRRFVATLPQAVFAAPARPEGGAPWYTAVCRAGDLDRTSMIYFIRPREVRQFEEVEHGRRGLGGALAGFLRGGARLRPSVRTHVSGGAA